jgi:hypothetical protein
MKITMKNPGINQPPMCQPLQIEPGPQNIFSPPGILDDDNPHRRNAPGHGLKNSRDAGRQNSPDDHSPIAGTLFRLQLPEKEFFSA